VHPSGEIVFNELMVPSAKKDTRSARGSVTFAKYVGKYIRYYTLTLPRPIVLPKGYSVVPKTLGEHVRKRRLDLGLEQAQVAERIGVTTSTVYNWEHGRAGQAASGQDYTILGLSAGGVTDNHLFSRGGSKPFEAPALM